MKTEIHREYFLSGQIWTELHHKEGDYGYWHRTDGPAYIVYDMEGNIVSENYFINNKKYTKEEFDKKMNNNKPLYNLFGE